MDFKPVELSGKEQYVLVGIGRGFTIPNGASNNQAIEVLLGHGLIERLSLHDYQLTEYGRHQVKRYMGGR